MLRAGETALVLVDMQYHDAAGGHGFNLAWDIIRAGSMDYFNHRIEEQVVPTIRALLDYARRTGAMLPVFLEYGSDQRDLSDMAESFRARICRVEQLSGVVDIFWSGNPDFRIRVEIAPLPGELVIRKRSFSAFTTSTIHQTLAERGIRSIVLCGVSTSCCVESTARDAVDHGYTAVLVDAGLADYTHEAHVACLRNFEMNFGRVVADAGELIRLVT